MHNDRFQRTGKVVRQAILAVAVIALLAGQANATEKLEKQVLAVVNGDSIFTTDVAAVFSKMHSAMTADTKSNFDYHKLVDKLISDRLLIQEAFELGMADEEYVTRFMDGRKKTWVSGVFVRDNFQPDTTVSEASIQEFFKANYHKVRVRTLSVASKVSADSLLQQIRQGVPMDSLAKLYSVDMFRYVGGAQSMKYWITVEQELRDHLGGAKKGDLIGPFPYRAVYAIMRIEETAPADTSELAGMRDYLTSMLRETKRYDDWSKFVDGLAARYDLEVDSAGIRAIARSTKSVLDSTFQRGTERPVAKFTAIEPITEQELRQETAHAAMAEATTAVDTLLFKSLKKLVEDELLYRAGLDAKLDTLTAINRRLLATRDSVLIEVYLKETVAARIKFSRDEFQQYYVENKDKFREADDLTLRQVLIETQVRADSSVALLQDGADFDYVADKFRKGAKELSEKNVNVSMAAFPKSIQEDLAALTPGQSSKAYATSDGWVIFKLLDRKPGRVKSMEEVDMNIREAIFQRKFSTMLDETLARLKANSRIVKFNETIDQFLGVEN